MRLLVELATGGIFGGLITVVALLVASLYPGTLKTIDALIVPIVLTFTIIGCIVGSSIYEHFSEAEK